MNQFSVKMTGLAVICVAFSSASANMVGNDTQNFNPTPGGVDFITVHGSQTLYPGIFNFGLFWSQAHNVLPDVKDDMAVWHKSNDDLQFVDFNFAYGITERLEAGVNFSILTEQTSNRHLGGAQFSATGLNEIRLLGKYNFAKGERGGLAAMLSSNLNQTRNNPFTGENPHPTVNFELGGDRKLGNFLLAANIGYRWRSSGEPYEESFFEPLTDQLIASTAGSYYFSEYNLKVIGEVFAAQQTESSNGFEAGRLNTEYLAGLKYDASRSMAFQLGGGSRVGSGLFSPDWRVYAGLNWVSDWSKKASDPDFVPLEQTPVEARPTEVQPVVQKYSGFQPRDIETFSKQPFEILTNSHEFHLKTQVPDPHSTDPKPPFEVIRLEGFDFDFGSSQIRPEYDQLLRKLATYLKTEPPVLKVRVEGHTDSLGTEERNKFRSESRAQAVRDYISNLIDKKQYKFTVDAIGFGSSKPIADNSNFQGRKINRRVEIRILRQITQPIETIE